MDQRWAPGYLEIDVVRSGVLERYRKNSVVPEPASVDELSDSTKEIKDLR
ncbi:hypothetical protein [Nocardia sp. NPDC052112]